ncbi:uncharacterized protein LOC131183793 isoform X3 [Hevea brasiliensis]|uniref:uncharacterized protein LOC131183793 isoform X3 n=1 Tax=Hevea brasiliensis TaxID=3981 RepID=UPI0025F48202|nr:uncharacterized protein LOC131183793 isoform X3 [Hevea brasiliensis]
MSEVRVNIRAADRPRDPARWSEIAVVVSALSVPVIANGDVFDYGDFERIEVATGASSVIVARGALLNASVFSPEGKGYWEEVKGDCVKKERKGIVSRRKSVVCRGKHKEIFIACLKIKIL